jgi:adenylate kinase
MILLISGTPATGKTAVAQILGEKLGWKVISLNEFAAERNLHCGYDEKRKAKIVDIDRVKEEVGRIVEKEENLILESHYAHEMPGETVVILRVNPDELRKRGKEKQWWFEKIEENVISEIMEVCKTEALEMGKKVIEIDTTGKKPGQVADEIIKKLELK